MIENRLQRMGIVLPKPPKPVAAYIPAITVGNLVYISGQDCKRDGILPHKGKLGQDLSIDEGYDAARQAMINCLALLKEYLGDLDRIKRIIKLTGFVASAPGFNQQPFVINGASELLEQVFGENGKHARSAIGTNELPFGTPVEIEMILEIR